MIEFLWVHSEEAAKSAPIAQTRLLERFRYKFTGMQVSLNMEREAQRIDLRPSTPLVIEW
jgi:hypothetical protein